MTESGKYFLKINDTMSPNRFRRLSMIFRQPDTTKHVFIHKDIYTGSIKYINFLNFITYLFFGWVGVVIGQCFIFLYLLRKMCLLQYLVDHHKAGLSTRYCSLLIKTLLFKSGGCNKHLLLKPDLPWLGVVMSTGSR